MLQTNSLDKGKSAGGDADLEIAPRRFGLGIAVLFALSVLATGLPARAASQSALARPQGPCDIYAAAGDPCVAAYSTTRALYRAYDGPLYQVMRQSDGRTADIGVVRPTASPSQDGGGYADAAAQDRFCAQTACWVTEIYDQSSRHNNLTQAPRGGFSGPALGGMDSLPLAGMAPVTVMGHKAYGVYIAPGMGLRDDDPRDTAVDDQAEGEYWVVDGSHYNAQCCFDFGNGEIDSRDDDNGTMEAIYFGNVKAWFRGAGNGPWIMTDQENNLVGCVNVDGTKGCPNLPSIPWRFVTAIAKGKPHRWATLGGDAQKGSLTPMFDGPRVNATYDPMRKQGAILLGNGGDNSNRARGTFYEGVMTAAGTYPSEATEQKVQANIVAAGYDVPALVWQPGQGSADTRIQTFTPGASQNVSLKFTNTMKAPAAHVTLAISLPTSQWSAYVEGTREKTKKFTHVVAPGESVEAVFKVTSGPAPFNGDLVGRASWAASAAGRRQLWTTAERVRNAPPIAIEAVHVASGPADQAGSSIELHNAGSQSVDLSGWTLTVRPSQQAIFSAVAIPAGTRLAGGASYRLALAGSGLVVGARAGDSTIYVRSTEGISSGDTISIGSSRSLEHRTVASVGTAAANHTTLWQPLPDGPILKIGVGSANVPVESTSGFAVGQKVALGYGSGYPDVALARERYEIATITAVGKPGTQAYLAADARAGATNIKVTSVENISAGDRIRLDIASVGHGIETVTVSRVGTAASRTNLAADAADGATSIKVRSAKGFRPGDRVTIGTPANRQVVTIAAVGASGQTGTEIRFTPALDHAHIKDELVVEPGTGLDLAAPLKFNHAANLPFSDRGTGISFEPATRFVHISNEPVRALGTGIRLARPLRKDHPIHSVVEDAAAGASSGAAQPSQWFGGPELTTTTLQFGHPLVLREGSVVLRNRSSLVVDSLNYGGLADPVFARSIGRNEPARK